MMIFVPLSASDVSSGASTWTEGNLAGYYKTNEPINDVDIYNTLLYTFHFDGLMFGQSMNDVGTDKFREINEEYGLCTEVNSSSMVDGSIINISGVTNANRTLNASGLLFSENSPYSGELIQKINEYFGTVDKDKQISVYDNFNRSTASVNTSTFSQASDGYVYKECRMTSRITDVSRLDIVYDNKNVSFYSSIDYLYETITQYTYAESIMPEKEAPSKCTMTVTVNILSTSYDVTGTVDGTEYKGAFDINKLLDVGTHEYKDTSVVKFPAISPETNASTAKVASDETLQYFGNVLGCTVSSYYTFVKEKVDAALNVKSPEKGFDIMDFFGSDLFKAIIIILIVIAAVYVVYRLLFYIKHRWY